MKVKVLVVEDSEAERGRLVRLLEGCGYDAVTAAGAFEALSVASRERPDVVLLGQVLGSVDGRALCRMLRQSDVGHDLAIVLLTAKTSANDAIEGSGVSADDCLPKPLHPHELGARIAAALRARGDRPEPQRPKVKPAEGPADTEVVPAYDLLTRLANRHRFIEWMRTEWTRASRWHLPLSCALIDLDRLKQINDRVGRTMGDQVLRRVAELIRLSSRNVGVAARFGGDEFAVLLPDYSAPQSHVLFERLRSNLRAERTSWAHVGPVTLSIGIACTEDEALLTPGDLIKAANRALYVAKRCGRDRVVTAVPLGRAAAMRA